MVATKRCLMNRFLTSASVNMAVAETSGKQIAIFNGFVVTSGQRIGVTDEVVSA